MVNALFVLALTASLAVLASATESVETAEAPAQTMFAPQVDYCNLRSCNGPVHTLCQYPFLQPARQCGRVLSSVMTPYEIQGVLDAHNFRSRVPLTWDAELAGIAQTWADQCITRVDQCRNTQYLTVAQRYAYRKTTGPIRVSFADLVDANSVPEGTTLVGCGGIRFNPDGRFNWIHLVCNYANGGY